MYAIVINLYEADMYEKISDLVRQWEDISRRKFISAKQQHDIAERPTGTQFIEHGAICYLNCARELREALSSLLLLPSGTPKRGQK